MRVEFSSDAATALGAAGDFLRSMPVEHSVILSVMAGRVKRPLPGRYWWAVDGDEVCGFVMQSPLDFKLAPGPVLAASVDALVDAVAAMAPDAPGVIGDALTAARFAGRWATVWAMPATTVEGGRIYVLGTLVEPSPVAPGTLRLAVESDVDRATEWIIDFAATGDLPSDPSWAADRIADRRLWVWDIDGEPVSMAAATEPVAGFSRIGGVYTPPHLRRRGYAAACVAELSRWVETNESARCMLHTQLANPTSNAIYQRLGYEAVGETLVYRFG